MFNYIPKKFANETAETIEEAERWVQGDNDARRPPELLTRDVVAKAIIKEVKAGRGSKHGGVYLDIASRREKDYIKKKLPSMYHQFKELAEIDITEEPMEVGPTLHYFMGGIRVDSDTQQTSVSGLFACGECAGGMHGANRLGGNSLSDLLVFGKLAGDGAISYIKNITETLNCNMEDVSRIIKNATDILNRNEGTNPYVVHEHLQNIMQDHVGIVRTGEELESGLKKLDEIKSDINKAHAHASAQYNPGWNEAIDLQNLIVTAEAVTRAAILREESRGAHTRLDFEGEREEGLGYNIVIKKSDKGMLAEKINRDTPPSELSDIAHASLRELEGENIGA